MKKRMFSLILALLLLLAVPAYAAAGGADDPLVRMQLTQALCALLGLQASAVSVVSASGGGL